jgi:hypothetical protein
MLRPPARVLQNERLEFNRRSIRRFINLRPPIVRRNGTARPSAVEPSELVLPEVAIPTGAALSQRSRIIAQTLDMEGKGNTEISITSGLMVSTGASLFHGSTQQAHSTPSTTPTQFPPRLRSSSSQYPDHLKKNNDASIETEIADQVSGSHLTRTRAIENYSLSRNKSALIDETNVLQRSKGSAIVKLKPNPPEFNNSRNRDSFPRESTQFLERRSSEDTKIRQRMASSHGSGQAHELNALARTRPSWPTLTNAVERPADPFGPRIFYAPKDLTTAINKAEPAMDPNLIAGSNETSATDWPAGISGELRLETLSLRNWLQAYLTNEISRTSLSTNRPSHMFEYS